MKYIKRLIYDMRHQKMMTWISISGTAVAVFLVMVLFMADRLKTVEIAPDNNRQRIYAGMKIQIKSTSENDNWMMMGDLSYEAAQRLFGDIKGVEMVSYIDSYATLRWLFHGE